MLRDVLSNGLLTHFATIGLVIFVAVFAGTCAWILTRSRREVSDWSRIPLTGDDEGPVDDRQA
ncbi:hypothetical protein Poly30_55990 [Planctomycetes bacterium Poly30]|uniref:Cbb3-type cytochrome oxidase component FixQ n=1 Tax=Saltatorellus ferox TaxID=2528018 RepID=A0A518F122_9BACT|nr:hypothetical protein Poly30_55990 [Planctomycetes bacterium Poly30]